MGLRSEGSAFCETLGNEFIVACRLALPEILGLNLANRLMYTPLLLSHLVHGGREMSAELIELSNALAQATDHAAASVAAIHTEPRGSSSGVIWRDGVIVTAVHSPRHHEEIQVTLPNGRLPPANLAGRDSSTDLAVLRCAEANRPPMQLAESSSI